MNTIKRVYKSDTEQGTVKITFKGSHKIIKIKTKSIPLIKMKFEGPAPKDDAAACELAQEISKIVSSCGKSVHDKYAKMAIEYEKKRNPDF